MTGPSGIAASNTSRSPEVLVVEDDSALRESLVETLSLAGIRAVSVGDGSQALLALESEPFRVVLTDIRMSPMGGLDLLHRMVRRGCGAKVVLMTAYGCVPQAVDAMRLGASDYLLKPFDAQVVVEKVSQYLAKNVAEESEVAAWDDSQVVSVDPRSKALYVTAARVARSDVTVLIAGESGTGKEVMARYIHRLSRRSQCAFVAVNCAAIPESMLEAVLFGYEKGAYTGAHRAQAGKFEQAQGGVLLLDEISEMPLMLQAKLLRVLQEREVERLGGGASIKLDVRVFATTNRDLAGEVSLARFREDLYYRLNVFPLVVVPLRDRPEDIVPMARHFLRRHRQDEVVQFSPAAEARLQAHSWPGNVRELENAVQRALVLADNEFIEPSALDLPNAIHSSALHSNALRPTSLESSETPSMLDPSAPRGGDTSELPSTGGAGKQLGERLRDDEYALILAVLRESKSRVAAAERLGISPRTLRYKLARMRAAGIEVP